MQSICFFWGGNKWKKKWIIIQMLPYVWTGYCRWVLRSFTSCRSLHRLVPWLRHDRNSRVNEYRICQSISFENRKVAADRLKQRNIVFFFVLSGIFGPIKSELFHQGYSLTYQTFSTCKFLKNQKPFSLKKRIAWP